MSTDPFDTALTVARAALAEPPAGLLTDLDGTLAPIVSDPAAVRLAPGAAEALIALAGRLAVVGVVTGRAALDARRITGLPDLLVAGNHGIEWLAPGRTAPEVAPHLADVPAALDRLLAAVPSIAGVSIDDKALSATVHYRNAADPAAARDAILGALRDRIEGGGAGSSGVELREGRMSVELRPRDAGDKGSAVTAVVERYALRGLVVLGDDLTDLDMFRAAIALREGGRLRAAVIAVGGDGEVPPQVAEAADALVRGPDEVVRLLSALA